VDPGGAFLDGGGQLLGGQVGPGVKKHVACGLLTSPSVRPGGCRFQFSIAFSSQRCQTHHP
jgi:hypothetical protein